MNQQEVKDYIVKILYGQNTNLDAYSLLDAAHNPKTTIFFSPSTLVTKEVSLGKETVPKIGHVDIISNDFWDLQDNGLKRLFPELTHSTENFEFLITIIDDVKFNKKINKIEVIQKRQKFWISNKIS